MKLQQPTSPTGPPDFLTLDEAAAVIRIGRTVAYQLARRYLDTDGREGLPVVRFGKQLRFPRCRLEEFLGGPITWPPPPPDSSPLPPEPALRSIKPRPRPSNARQSAFPFTA
jgi:hypothetical protein